MSIDEFSKKCKEKNLNPVAVLANAKDEQRKNVIYNKALSRCKKVTGNDFPTYLDVIVFLSKEIDYYREKIKRLEGEK